MNRLEVVRALVLVVPCVALWLAARVGPSTRREHGALLLAGVGAFVGLGVLHEFAHLAGWWSYLDVAGTWRGFPVDLWIGWAVLWGPLPVALRRIVGLPTALVVAAWLDVLAMPALAPLVVLDDGWLWGELVGLAGVLAPAGLLGRWTADARHLAARVTLQVGVFAGVVFWLLPTTVFTLGDGSWAQLTGRSHVEIAILIQLAAVLALPALAAVQELAEHGGGTPFPWDPPDRLVTTGPYAYLANPMQASATALLAVLAVVTQSWSLGAAAAAAIAFSVTIAEPHEREHLRARFGPAYERHRVAVRAWWPRWRPAIARDSWLFVDADCQLCRELGVALTAAEPARLRWADAADHPHELARVHYTDGEVTDDGLPAIGRALGHLHLGAAAIGWVVRLPVLRAGLQLVADTVAPPARPVARVGPAGAPTGPGTIPVEPRP